MPPLGRPWLVESKVAYPLLAGSLQASITSGRHLSSLHHLSKLEQAPFRAHPAPNRRHNIRLYSLNMRSLAQLPATLQAQSLLKPIRFTLEADPMRTRMPMTFASLAKVRVFRISQKPKLSQRARSLKLTESPQLPDRRSRNRPSTLGNYQTFWPLRGWSDRRPILPPIAIWYSRRI